MINYKLYLRKHTAKKDTGVIYVSFYINREKVHFSTKVECTAENWDVEDRIVKSSAPVADDKNLILNDIKSRINDVFVKYRLKNKRLTRQGFIRHYNRPSDYSDFYAYYTEKKKQWSRSLELQSVQNHNTVYDKLKAFRSELEFDDITDEFLADFYAHLRKTLKNNENTAYKNMSILRRYVRRAHKEGYLDEYPFDDFSIPKVSAKVSYLTEEELKLLIDYYKKGELNYNQYRTLQLFLFMCFGSQHIGDAISMQLEQFGSSHFTYTRMKLRNRKPSITTVPISKSLRTIIADIAGHRKVGPLFEHLPAEQTMNRHLRDIAAAAGIKKHISHKTARHTFATIFLANTKDLNSLKDIMGHSNLQQTLVYAHALEISKNRGVSCFNKFM